MLRRLCLPLLGLTLLAALAGPGLAGTAAVPTLDASRLPLLPSQGLLLAEGGGLVLMGLDGHVYGRLAGFQVYPGPGGANGKRFVADVGVQALQTADPTLAAVFDRAGQGWLLDAAGDRLVRLGVPEVALAGNARLRIKVSGNDAGVTTNAIIERAGVTLLSGDVTVIGTRYAASANYDSKSPGELLDLVSGERWKLLPQCSVAGVVDGRALAVCAPPGPNPDGRKPYRLYAFGHDGASVTLATFAPGLFANTVSLSPDGRWLLAYMSPGCGPGWSAVYRVSGGTGRFVTDDGVVPVRGSLPTARYSYGLGWTGDDRVVADISAPKGSSCDKELSSGTFVIDPATLSRLHLTSVEAALMWNTPAPG